MFLFTKYFQLKAVLELCKVRAKDGLLMVIF